MVCNRLTVDTTISCALRQIALLSSRHVPFQAIGDLGPFGSLGVHTADFNGDGFVDILATGVLSQGMMLWLNNGAGEFSYKGQFLFAGYMALAAVGDIDGDGDIDIVSTGGAESTPPEPGLTYLNNGDGFFYVGATDLFTNTVVNRIELADFDGDMDLDAYVVVSSTVGQDRIFWNDGAGNFAAGSTYFDGPQTRDVAISDLDQDSDLDLMIARGNADTQVWINDGTGQFSLTMTLQPSYEIALGDLNGDEIADLVISPSYPFSLEVWLNDGNGQFASHSSLPTSGGSDFIVADVNNDEANDLFFINAECCPGIYQDSFSVWQNDGTAQFTPVDLDFARNIRDFALADLDEDDDLDFVFGQNAYSGFGILQPIWLFDEPISPLAPITIIHDAMSYTVDSFVFFDLDISSGTVISAQWDFGNGRESELLRPAAWYSEPGTYTVSVTLTNSLGSVQAQKTMTVTDTSSQTHSVTHPATALVREPIAFETNPGFLRCGFW